MIGRLKLISKDHKLTVFRQCELLEVNRPEKHGEPVASITLPELKVSLSGSTSVTIPLVVQHGETIKRCHLCFSVQLKEESP